MPTLGICLGSQLIAHALGARVYPNVRGGKLVKEIGYYTVRLTAEGTAHPLFKGCEANLRMLEWHGDAFDVPRGASLLATSPTCPHQVFSYQNAYGILFHPEATPELVRGLEEITREWAHESFELDEERLVKKAQELAPLMKAQCYRLLDNFFA